MEKTIFDLTTFDNVNMFNIEFDSIKDIDNYIYSANNLNLKHKDFKDVNTDDFISRNYVGDYRYFKGKNKTDEFETFAILRTTIQKIKDKFVFSSFDFGYHSPLGWNDIYKYNNIDTIENANSHKVRFRQQGTHEHAK